MDFIDQIKQFSSRVDSMKDNIQTEEATKTSIIMPFFSLLGYDVFNPDEFMPEFTADVGIKKGEKVDYAIIENGEPNILIEVKWIGEPLQRHDSQLFRYFGTSNAKFAILTNGQHYKFFTDLDSPNKMDESPFMTIDILDIKDAQVLELKKFHKSNFKLEEIMTTASELKYSNEFKSLFANELQNPSDDFVRFFLASAYTGVKTQNIVDRFRPVLKKSLNQYISETMNDKIKIALNDTHQKEPEVFDDISNSESDDNNSEINPAVVTTQEELEGYYIIKGILCETIDINSITYKDTIQYFAITVNNMVTKWVCRLRFGENVKYLIIPDENKDVKKYPLETVVDIYKYKNELIASAMRFIN